MMAQAMKAHAAVTTQRGRRVTAASILVSRSDQCASIMQEGHDPDLQHFARGKDGIAVRVTAKHSAEHARGDGEIRRAKKYPGDADRDVSDRDRAEA